MRFHPDGGLPTNPAAIWVFGSNLAGRHGKGAALVARNQFGAVYGEGEGRTGQAYAVPTKDAHLHSLDLPRIERGVRDFLAYAAAYPHLEFYVTGVACGLAGYQNSEIAPLFAACQSNCILPEAWREWCDHAMKNPLPSR